MLHYLVEHQIDCAANTNERKGARMPVNIYEHFTAREMNLLKARAERAASKVMEPEQTELLTVLFVRIGSEQFAIPLEDISNVYTGLGVTPVPCVPPGVAGITNIR